MKTSLLLVALAPLLATPALWLLWRQPARWALFAAAMLLLLATATGYTGIRLGLDRPLPFQLTAKAGHFQTITPAELPAALAASRGRPILLEFYADWCSSCQVWKQRVFNRADVQVAMAPLLLLQIDASNLTPDVQQLLDQHGLAGLPAILIYNRYGMEKPELRLLGEMTASSFIVWITSQALPAL